MWKSCIVSILVLLVACDLMVYGIKDLLDVQNYKHPKVITFDELAKQHPTEGWYKITRCLLHVSASAYSTMQIRGVEDTEHVSEVYVPVQQVGEPKDKDFEAVVVTKDPQIVATVEEMQKLDVKNKSDKARAWVSKNINRLFIKKDITGMVGIETLTTWAKKGVAELQDITTPNCISIKEGAKPSATKGVIGVVLGTLTLGLLAFYWLVVARIARLNHDSSPDTRNTLPSEQQE